MSLVENLINQISTQGLSGISKPLGDIGLADDTFSQILDKQLSNVSLPETTLQLGNFGVPAGLIIEPIDGVDFSNTVQDQMEILGEKNLSREEYINQPIEFKDITMEDYFSNLLKNNGDKASDFMNFAKRQATNFYGVQGRNLILDTKEFVIDVLKS